MPDKAVDVTHSHTKKRRRVYLRRGTLYGGAGSVLARLLLGLTGAPRLRSFPDNITVCSSHRAIPWG